MTHASSSHKPQKAKKPKPKKIALLPPGAKLTLRIEGFDDEGRGRAVHIIDGEEVDVAVRGAFPGDLVEAKIDRVFKGRRLLLARRTLLLEAGEARVKTECTHIAPCPGCPLGEASPEFAAEVKKGRVLQALSLQELDFLHPKVAPVVMDGLWGTRQKVRLVAAGMPGQIRLGLYAPYSHKVMSAHRCAVGRPAIVRASEALLDVLRAERVPAAVEGMGGIKSVMLREMDPYADELDEDYADELEEDFANELEEDYADELEEDFADELEEDRFEGSESKELELTPAQQTQALLELAEAEEALRIAEAEYADASAELNAELTDDRPKVACVLQTEGQLTERAFTALAALVDKGVLFSLTERTTPMTGQLAAGASQNSLLSGEITRQIGPKVAIPLGGGPAVDADGFCQAHAELSHWLYEKCAAFLTEDAPEDAWFLDGYAGTGGFARALLVQGAARVIGVEIAENCHTPLQQSGALGLLCSMEDALPDLQKKAQIQTPYGAVFDPPRKGVREMATPLLQLGFEKIALVSCDPDAMAKDLKTMLAAGYEVERLVPVDLFPTSTSIEVMTLLRRSR